jgi:hypothetical protein
MKSLRVFLTASNGSRWYVAAPSSGRAKALIEELTGTMAKVETELLGYFRDRVLNEMERRKLRVLRRAK